MDWYYQSYPGVGLARFTAQLSADAFAVYLNFHGVRTPMPKYPGRPIPEAQTSGLKYAPSSSSEFTIDPLNGNIIINKNTGQAFDAATGDPVLPGETPLPDEFFDF